MYKRYSWQAFHQICGNIRRIRFWPTLYASKQQVTVHPLKCIHTRTHTTPTPQAKNNTRTHAYTECCKLETHRQGLHEHLNCPPGHGRDTPHNAKVQEAYSAIRQHQQVACMRVCRWFCCIQNRAYVHCSTMPKSRNPTRPSGSKLQPASCLHTHMSVAWF